MELPVLDLSAPALPLTLHARGRRACIAHLALGDADAQRLRDLGVREGACVCVMMNADKCILALDGQARLALQREVAMQVFAAELPA